MSDSRSYVLSSPSDRVLQRVQESFRVRKEHLQPQVSVYYDTFDWRLYRARTSLYGIQNHGGITLHCTGGNGQPHFRLKVQQPPGFEWELPPGPLRNALRPLIKMRRLLPVVKVEQSCLIMHLLGSENKTVARLALLQALAHAPDTPSESCPLPNVLRTTGLKGNEQEHKRLVSFLEGEMGLAPESRSLLERVLRAGGRSPGGYSSKLRVDLEPGMRTIDAAKTIYQVLLETILSNEGGTRQDLDTEFLHDFRVAVRRTRAGLSQIKRIFPQKTADHFLGEFSWLGRATGPTRNLDVYLLKMEDYKSSLPEAIRDDLKPLCEFLQSRQKEEHGRLVEALDSQRYRELVEQWRNFLDSPLPATELLPKGEAPVLQASSRRIWRVYKRILKKGKAITDDSPAEALHNLRIECKKLRYLMEFFRSLYPPGEINKAIKSLRRLQDNLGELNDFEVQQRTLRDFGQRMVKEEKGVAETLMVMGRLVERLEVGQREERRRFSKRFARFASPRNKRQFHLLFSPPKGEMHPD